MARDSSSEQQRLLQYSAPVVALCERAWNQPGLSARLTLVVGHRLERSLGRCYPERGLVRIARSALELPSDLRDEIICHEAAHLVVFERHGRSKRPHGSEWKDLMRSVGFTPRVRIQLALAATPLSASSTPLGGHPKPAMCGRLKTGHRRG